jgi:hypothetical protein
MSYADRALHEDPVEHPLAPGVRSRRRVDLNRSPGKEDQRVRAGDAWIGRLGFDALNRRKQEEVVAVEL